MRRGRYAEAEPRFLEVLEAQKSVLGDEHPDTALTNYNLGCLEALKGDRAKAMAWLGKALDSEFADVRLITDDADLESLHGPEFDALVERARQNAASRGAN